MLNGFNDLTQSQSADPGAIAGSPSSLFALSRLRRFLVGTMATLLLGSLLPLADAGEVKTLFGSGKGGFNGDDKPFLETDSGQPFGLVIGPDGALYVCEYTGHLIRRLDLATGKVSTFAGVPGKKGYAGDGGPATQALMNEPHELRFTPAGDMVIADMKTHTIRKIDHKTGIMTTLAGTGTAGFSGDGGPANKAQLNMPHSIQLDPAGGLLICDTGNHRVRKVDLETGLITTVYGTGEKKPAKDGDPQVGTPLNGPRSIDFTPSGDMILALREGNAVYRFPKGESNLVHIAGIGGKPAYVGDGIDARKATLGAPKGAAVDANGDIYLADTETHTIRVIRAKDGVIETVVGDGKAGDGPNGDAKKCRLNRPHGVYITKEGQLLIGDSSNNKIRIMPLR
jgi:DNA-binding beta-propeller fold protein YncE